MNTLKKGLAIAAVSAGIALGGSAASAATIVLTPQGDGYQGSFAVPNSGKKAFSLSYEVTLPQSGLTEVQLGVTGGLLSSASFAGTDIFNGNPDANTHSVSYSFPSLSAGTYTLTVGGKTTGAGAVTGSIGLTPAVPEPATWAMMIGGVGVVGGAMRRRNRVTTKLSFA